MAACPSDIYCFLALLTRLFIIWPLPSLLVSIFETSFFYSLNPALPPYLLNFCSFHMQYPLLSSFMYNFYSGLNFFPTPSTCLHTCLSCFRSQQISHLPTNLSCYNFLVCATGPRNELSNTALATQLGYKTQCPLSPKFLFKKKHQCITFCFLRNQPSPLGWFVPNMFTVWLLFFMSTFWPIFMHDHTNLLKMVFCKCKSDLFKGCQ